MRNGANSRSTTGRRPVAAAPAAVPAMMPSASGVLRTRAAPNSLTQVVALGGDALAEHEHAGVAAHLLGEGLADGVVDGHWSFGSWRSAPQA